MYQLPSEPGSFLFWGFIFLSIVMTAGFGLVSKSKAAAGAVAAWVLAAAFIAASGFLADFSTMPPRLLLLFAPTFIGVFVIAFSSVGKSLANRSLQFLIGFQSFRIIVELLIHQAVTEGIAPPQMTWSGYNYDILTGVSALLLIPFANRLPKWSVHVWNFAGAGLLLLVVSVAIVSMPTPFQQLKPDNVWVAHFPFVWLPVVMVSFALMGHLVLFRKLIAGDASEQSQG